jgi:hypothetical protein
MEAIATQLGVSQRQISTDLRGLEVTSKPPRPKGGRPKGSTKPRKIVEKHSTIVTLADAGTPKSEIAKETGVGERMVGRVLEVENARREAVETLFGLVAAQHFSKSGALRIEDAIRIYKARLEKLYWQRVNDEVVKRIASANDSTREQNKKLSAENIWLQQTLNKRGVFSETQFLSLLKCVHPDKSASDALRNEMMPLLLRNRERLVRSDTDLKRNTSRAA